jgi:dTDP-glucose 4,6-dehydratase
MRVLVTGGLGFIGSAFIRHLISETDHEVVNLDRIAYAATEGSLAPVTDSTRYRFLQCDLVDEDATVRAVTECRPDAIVHLAAETHVDRSIDGPRVFVDSNVIGTYNLLQAARLLPGLRRLVHVSTDEVFGSLSVDESMLDEESDYDPRSPYSATKAASDHLVRAWHETYGLPVVVTNCSNNYGPFQFPEKMIPIMIINAWQGQALPVYGDGGNVRDWLHVEDHARALLSAMERGADGETYVIGGRSRRTNLEVVEAICNLVNAQVDDALDRTQLIRFVPDRPGHNRRYAIDSSRIERELGWSPRYCFEDGLAATVGWYLANGWWWRPLMRRSDVGVRLGLQGVGGAQ